MPLSLNIVTDFGAVSGTDCASAFAQFNAYAVANQGSNQVILTIPAGTFKLESDQTVSGSNSQYWSSGINNLLVLGAGAGSTILTDNEGAGWYFGGGSKTLGVLGNQYLIATVAAGSTSVTLLTPASASNFTVGKYALIHGNPLQLGGTPDNPSRHDYVLVTAKDAVTGVITFSGSPLKRSYKSTWPADSLYTSDTQRYGPASIFPTYAWNGAWEYRDMTILNVEQTHAYGQSTTFTRCTFGRTAGLSGHATPFPTIAGSFNLIDCDFTATGCKIEVDKIIDTFYISGGNFGVIEFQSSSTDYFHADGATIGKIDGTPRRALIENSTITELNIGPLYYGHADEVVLRDSHVSAFTTTHNINKVDDITSYGTMTGGVMRLANNVNAYYGPYPFTDPGTWLMWSGSAESELAFQVTDVWADSSYTYISTTWPGGFPSGSFLNGSSQLGIRVHPAPSFTCTGCTGHDLVVALSAYHVDGDPIYSHYGKTYSSDGSGGTTAIVGDNSYGTTFRMWGKVESIEIDITNVCTASGKELRLTSEFNNLKVVEGDANSSPVVTSTFGIVVDLHSGPRTVMITPSDTIGEVGTDGNVTLPDVYTWIADVLAPWASDVTEPDNFVFTIQINTDQGITVEEVASSHVYRSIEIHGGTYRGY